MEAHGERGQRLELGARNLGGQRTRFRVWAPRVRRLELVVGAPVEQTVAMPAEGGGYFTVEAIAPPGTRYWYRLNGKRIRPDPASRYQPCGVHGPSEVVEPQFAWHDAAWIGIPLERCVFYEAHVGLYTPEGTFDSLIGAVKGLRELGVTALELMPVAQFPGARNWGYDGVYPFAPACCYGGPAGLKRLVDACHGAGMAVFLDTVLNHVGPEGNYLAEFGPYFSRRGTPWGRGVNFDGRGSAEVRRFFLESALAWIEDYHIDGLRLDSTQFIRDRSATHFLAELAERVHRRARELGREVHLIAENGLVNQRLLANPGDGGYGLDGLWNDDFHHALRAILTGERDGYLHRFGRFGRLAEVFERGWTRRVAGGEPSTPDPARLVVYAQNHDQVGNRAGGRRLDPVAGPDKARLAAAAVILGPFLPLLFMGEEYGEPARFFYFTDHSDPRLAEAVSEGRRREFRCLAAGEDFPAPQEPAAFERSRLHADLAAQPPHRRVKEFYRELLAWRARAPEVRAIQVDRRTQTIAIERAGPRHRVILYLHLGSRRLRPRLPEPVSSWRKLLESTEGSGLDGRPGAADAEGRLPCLEPCSFALFSRPAEG